MTSPIPEVAVLQHEKTEHGGLFEEYIRERRMGLYRLPVYETNEILPVRSTHLLVMGGPMSVNDEEPLPWLKAEKQLIREWIAGGRPVLGICLGAQLIASASGAAVRPCRPETGWFPALSVNMPVVPGLPTQVQVFQIHGETFGLPPGAVRVFRGEAVQNQGLWLGSALGLQFHPEVTHEMIREWTRDLPARDRSFVLAQSRQYLPASERICRAIADRFLSAPARGFSWVL